MDDMQIELLKRIVQTPSPTGFEVGVANVVRGELAGVADEVSTDTMGSVHATYQGYLHHGEEDFFDDGFDDCDDYDDADYDFDDDDAAGIDDDFDDDMDERLAECEADLQFSSHTLMFAAHMDEIGLMVTYISPEGFLSVSAIGGVDAAILPGMRVDVHTKGGSLRGVVGRKPIHLIQPDDRKSVTALDKLVIDLGMSAEHVKEQVGIGDPITFAVGFERFGDDMAVSRAFDDKAGVFVGCRVMQELAADEDYTGTFVAALTVQEEIGTRGAMTSAHSVKPDVAIAFDVTHATDYPGIDKTQHGEIICGEGPVIARGPNINPVVFERLVAAAEAEGIKYQIEAEPSVTGTDARAIQVTRGGIPTGLISIPLRYMHTPTEVINLNDLEGAVRLVARFARDLDDAFDFVPGHPDDTFSDERILDGGVGRIEQLMSEIERLGEELADLQAMSAMSACGDCSGCSSAMAALDRFGGIEWDDAEELADGESVADYDEDRDGFYDEDVEDYDDGLNGAIFSSHAPAIKIEIEVEDSVEDEECELEGAEPNSEGVFEAELAEDEPVDEDFFASARLEPQPFEAGLIEDDPSDVESFEGGSFEVEASYVGEDSDGGYGDPQPEAAFSSEMEPEAVSEPAFEEESAFDPTLAFEEEPAFAEASDEYEPESEFANGLEGNFEEDFEGGVDGELGGDFAGEPIQGEVYPGGFADVEIVDSSASDWDSDEEEGPDTITYDGFSAGSADMPTMSIPIITVSSADDAEER